MKVGGSAPMVMRPRRNPPYNQWITVGRVPRRAQAIDADPVGTGSVGRVPRRAIAVDADPANIKQ